MIFPSSIHILMNALQNDFHIRVCHWLDFILTIHLVSATAASLSNLLIEFESGDGSKNIANMFLEFIS